MMSHAAGLLPWSLLAFTLSLVATLAVERVARRRGLVAVLRDDRWHRAPVPLLGGVAITGTTVLGIGVAGWDDWDLLILTVAALAMATVGLVDDVRQLPPQAKLLAQVMLAAGLMHFGFALHLTGIPLVDVFFTLLWLVGITNAFNLLDNMDGLSSTIALIAAGFRGLFFLWEGDHDGAVAAAILIGAVAGFLVRNFPPARIFMGDTGSLFMGFFLAGLSLFPGNLPYSRGIFAVMVIPVMLLLIPIFDTTFVTITRLMSGRSLAVGGRDHTSHRLVAVGLSERQTLLCLGTIATLAGGVALLSYRYGFSYTVGLLAAVLLGIVLLGVYLSRVHVVRGDPANEVGGVLRLIADFQYKRQVATAVLDLVLIVLAYYSAYLLRFEGEFDAYSGILVRSLPIVLIVQVGALAAFGVHRGIWRYTGLYDALRIVKAVSAGTAGVMVALVFLYRFQEFSRSIFILYWILLLLGMAATRFSFRLFAEMFRSSRLAARRVLIYGAGGGGELLVRELMNNPDMGRVPVGFIDDDRDKHRRRIHGVAVLGGRERIRDIVRNTRAAEVIVASEKIGNGLDDFLETCRAIGVEVRRGSIRVE